MNKNPPEKITSIKDCIETLKHWEEYAPLSIKGHESKGYDMRKVREYLEKYDLTSL